MGGGHRPGTWGSGDDVPDLDDGTFARISTPIPSPAQPAGPSPGSSVAAPMSGGVPYAVGQAAIVRIPIPGTDGLCLEFSPKGWVPKTGSTSTLFFQDPTGKRQLRLDYGYNIKTRAIDYHWNQQGTFDTFGVPDHAAAGPGGGATYRAAKYFRFAGRALVVVGVGIDVVSIVQASNPLRRASEVVAGWAGAWVGCQLVGGVGAGLGTLASPLGTAAGGVAGCVVGGIGGYFGGSVVGAEVYDWAENTRFTSLPEAVTP